MRYTDFKSLLSDIQEGKLDRSTILVNISWQENALEIYNREEVIWHGRAKNTLFDLIHSLGIFTIDDVQSEIFNDRLDSQQHHKAAWIDTTNMSKEETFDYLYTKAKAQSQQKEK